MERERVATFGNASLYRGMWQVLVDFDMPFSTM